MVGENMEYLIGALLVVVFFICVLYAFYVGYKLGKRTNTAKVENEDDDMKKKAIILQKEFVELMNYDVTKALERKKVI
jgi:hypothetical protein